MALIGSLRYPNNPRNSVVLRMWGLRGEVKSKPCFCTGWFSETSQVALEAPQSPAAGSGALFWPLWVLALLCIPIDKTQNLKTKK